MGCDVESAMHGGGRFDQHVHGQLLRARRIQRFLSQPFFVASQFTGLEGRFVKLSDTITSFEEILSGKYDDFPEQAFYLQGDIEDVKRRAAELAKA